MLFSSLAGIAFIVSAVLLIANPYSKLVSGISLTFIGKDSEFRDPKIPLLSEKESLPEYKFEIKSETKSIWIVHGKTVTCGPMYNQSAAKPIKFVFADDMAFNQLQQITLIEDDKYDDIV